MAGAEVVGEVVGGGGDELDAGEGGEVGTGVVAGGVGVVDGEDALVAGEVGEVGEGGAVGGAAQGGDVAEVARRFARRACSRIRLR